ncbi:MAG: hypothetical protein GY881_10920 [Gammaproteobacteria bacterium]|nr:hypothetical protein [Gammaproteobacteria bacterium]MCP4879093.1 hypothetical protein [Gammaproteobacteria bacterium]MDP6165470.1 hypothetical protein [Gammaproteobacteria bacterium]
MISSQASASAQSHTSDLIVAQKMANQSTSINNRSVTELPVRTAPSHVQKEVDRNFQVMPSFVGIAG